ncbi:hypothetical protein CCUS01_00282 [Colletotrichum cuscutae]|uniref:Uncharacterized protein n=1 Tax=Colletotrichum cuscutae TaxID=1209917 RepID=A0AAI9YE29_9PEZI|nr:hypothetical protein CCUS01_00282 [Colletotrichum cuscutae]
MSSVNTRKVLPESETRWPNHLPDSTRPKNNEVKGNKAVINTAFLLAFDLIDDISSCCPYRGFYNVTPQTILQLAAGTGSFVDGNLLCALSVLLSCPYTSDVRVYQIHGSFVTLCDGMRILICEGLSKLSLSLALAVSVLFTTPCKIFSGLHELEGNLIRNTCLNERMIEFKAETSLGLGRIAPGSYAYFVACFLRFPAIFVGIELFFAVATYRDESEVYNVARSGSQVQLKDLFGTLVSLSGLPKLSSFYGKSLPCLTII